MMSIELILVAEPIEGLRRLCQRLSGLKIQYCSMRNFIEHQRKPKLSEEKMEEHKSRRNIKRQQSLKDAKSKRRINDRQESSQKQMIFYSCGVDDIDMFGRMRRASSRHG